MPNETCVVDLLLDGLKLPKPDDDDEDFEGPKLPKLPDDDDGVDDDFVGDTGLKVGCDDTYLEEPRIDRNIDKLVSLKFKESVFQHINLSNDSPQACVHDNVKYAGK